MEERQDGNIIKRDIEQEMRTAYIDYAMSVIVSRALPDVSHRAALGLSEQTDAIILVVSEETGALSIACESRLYYDLSLEQVRKMLENHLELSDENFTSMEETSIEQQQEEAHESK